MPLSADDAHPLTMAWSFCVPGPSCSLPAAGWNDSLCFLIVLEPVSAPMSLRQVSAESGYFPSHLPAAVSSSLWDCPKCVQRSFSSKLALPSRSLIQLFIKEVVWAECKSVTLLLLKVTMLSLMLSQSQTGSSHSDL